MNTLYVNNGSSRPGKDDGEFTASDMLRLLRDHLGMLFLFIGIAAALATAYAFLAKPIYSSDVVVRVDPPIRTRSASRRKTRCRCSSRYPRSISSHPRKSP